MGAICTSCFIVHYSFKVFTSMQECNSYWTLKDSTFGMSFDVVLLYYSLGLFRSRIWRWNSKLTNRKIKKICSKLFWLRGKGSPKCSGIWRNWDGNRWKWNWNWSQKRLHISHHSGFKVSLLFFISLVSFGDSPRQGKDGPFNDLNSDYDSCNHYRVSSQVQNFKWHLPTMRKTWYLRSWMLLESYLRICLSDMKNLKRNRKQILNFLQKNLNPLKIPRQH